MFIRNLLFLVLIVGFSVVLSGSSLLQAALSQHHSHSQHHVNEHAPISIMGDHNHDLGEWMLSYRFMSMEMVGLLSGGSELSQDTALSEYMMSPEKMSMSMYMLGGMYGLTDRATLMIMLPYVSNSMKMRNRMTKITEMSSEGLGDIKASILYQVQNDDNSNIHLNLGASLPTGAIDKAAVSGARLPYSMQLGSGSLDFIPGITYLGFQNDLSWGAQASATVRSSDNSEAYRLGNRLDLTAWGSKSWSSTVSNSLRLRYQSWGSISGNDAQIQTAAAKALPKDTKNSGGSRLDIGLGLNYLFDSGTFKDHRLALEYSLPIAQRLDGSQLKTESLLVFGWQKAW